VTAVEFRSRCAALHGRQRSHRNTGRLKNRPGARSISWHDPPKRRIPKGIRARFQRREGNQFFAEGKSGSARSRSRFGPLAGRAADRKQFGKGAVMKLDGNNIVPIEGIPTGSLSLDIALAGRGFPAAA